MLDNSGRTIEEDAHGAMEVKRFFKRTPGSTTLFFGFSGNGMVGKSS